MYFTINFPFIKFDKNGVCNICKYHKPRKLFGKERLFQFANEIEKSNVDCLVPLSGGRDSTYAIHYIKNILKLNPIILMIGVL